MLITGFDTETTGLDWDKDGHRIIEVALLTYDAETEKLVDSYVQRINPHRAIDPGAEAIHHISISDLIGEPAMKDVAPTILEKMEASDLIVAHNMGFDGPFMAAELLNSGLEPPATLGFCTKENARWATPDGKYPKLGELCFALGVTYEPAKAHSASYDVEVMMACFFRAYKRGFFDPANAKRLSAFKNAYGT